MNVRAAGRAAVFVDKDGTLVEDVPFNVDPALVRLTRHAVEGLRTLDRAGYAIVLVTNQPGIATGRFSPADFNRLQSALTAMIGTEAGVALTGFHARVTTKARAAPRHSASRTTASARCQFRVARIFNTYGPRLCPGDGRVVSNFIVQAPCGEPLTVYGHGQQTRSFCYVDDTVDGLLRLMDRRKRADQPRQSGRAHRARVRRAGAAVDRQSIAAGAPSASGRRSAPALSGHRRGQASARLAAARSLDEGLERTIAYFRTLLGLSRTQTSVMPATERVT